VPKATSLSVNLPKDQILKLFGALTGLATAMSDNVRGHV
jgi:hypothetical protein